MSDGHGHDIDLGTETAEMLATDRVVEQLLDGVDGDSLPTSLRVLTPLVAAARRPPTAGELAREFEMAAMFQAVRPAVRPTSASARRRSLGVRIVVVAGLVSVSTASAAAAAGRLPEPVQETAAAVLAKVGISVPATGTPTVNLPADTPDEVVPAVPTTMESAPGPLGETTAAPPAESSEIAVTFDTPNAPAAATPGPAAETTIASPDEAATDDDQQEQAARARRPLRQSRCARPDASTGPDRQGSGQRCIEARQRA